MSQNRTLPFVLYSGYHRVFNADSLFNIKLRSKANSWSHCYEIPMRLFFWECRCLMHTNTANLISFDMATPAFWFLHVNLFKKTFKLLHHFRPVFRNLSRTSYKIFINVSRFKDCLMFNSKVHWQLAATILLKVFRLVGF